MMPLHAGDGSFTGRVNGTIPAFVCGAGVVVELDQLCDGVDDCGGGGDDEETALCESEFCYNYLMCIIMYIACLWIHFNCRQVLVSILWGLSLFKRMCLY